MAFSFSISYPLISFTDDNDFGLRYRRLSVYGYSHTSTAVSSLPKWVVSVSNKFTSNLKTLYIYYISNLS